MRKISFVLSMLLLLAFACPTSAEEAAKAPAPLTLDELLAWRDTAQLTLKDAEVTNDPKATYDAASGEVYTIEYAFATVDAAAEKMDAEVNPILGLELTRGDMKDPRGLAVGDSLDALLAAYPNENPTLVGDAHYAALYAHQPGEMGEGAMGWGWVLRNGPVVEYVQYAVSQRQADGSYVDAGLIYRIDGQNIAAIRLYGFDHVLSEEEVLSNVQSVHDIASETSYDPTADVVEAEATRFVEEDLVFAGFDFRKSTPEAILSLFGTPQDDRELTEGEHLRVITYPDALFEFAIDEFEVAQLRSVLVNMQTLRGPRGLRVGDGMGDVLDLFYRVVEGEDAAEIQLYGEGNTPPFGLISFQEGGETTVRYAFTLVGEGEVEETYVLHLFFQGDELREYIVYLQ